MTCLLSTAVAAQSPDGNILTYMGPDRTEKLIAGAKQEGELTYYSAMIVNQALRPLTAAFQNKYPFIKMAFWRADSEEIEIKLSAEMRANNLIGDVIEGTGIGELAVRAGLAQPILSPQLAGIPEKMHDADHLWVPTRMSYFSIAYNTSLVPAGTQPKTYDDLMMKSGRAEWRGRYYLQLARHCSSPIFVWLGAKTRPWRICGNCALRTSSISAQATRGHWWTE